MDPLHIKYEKLRELLSSLGSVAVAFSAGVDSTFLLKTAHDVLGEDAVAVTAEHGAFPGREMSEAVDFCTAEKIKHIKIPFDATSVEGFCDNPPDRCYICKKALFGKIIEKAIEGGFLCVAEGSNLDDDNDYRPGARAIAELGVNSPLKEAGLTKQDIRALSRELGLPTWDKPSYACLATRIPYGEKITLEKLSMIERSEQFLFDLGFRQSRVRHHGDTARIEIERADFERIIDPQIRYDISNELKEIGFRYVSVDLEGYRTGSMNRNVET
ncbi:MAG: ATP-dependent sacrificial sulfur transferase LarE [Clostridia bacterium]|nr:ATP-dependent sacrificial sulfur transferase LarE [Clostridia bacterium]